MLRNATRELRRVRQAPQFVVSLPLVSRTGLDLRNSLADRGLLPREILARCRIPQNFMQNLYRPSSPRNPVRWNEPTKLPTGRSLMLSEDTSRGSRLLIVGNMINRLISPNPSNYTHATMGKCGRRGPQRRLALTIVLVSRPSQRNRGSSMMSFKT